MAVGLGKDRERAAAGVKHRGTELLAVQVGGRLDARLLERHHGGRRVVVDHHDGHGLVGRVGVVGVEFHQRGQVGKTHVVSARCHARHGAARAVARVNRHVQLGVLEIPLGGRHQEQGGRAFKAPVELELDGRGLGLGGAKGGSSGQRSGGLEENAFFHLKGSRTGRGNSTNRHKANSVPDDVVAHQGSAYFL